MSTFRIDFRGPLGQAQELADGTLRVPAYLARTGVQHYTYSDGRRVREHRPADEVFSEDSLATFRGAAITVEHPAGKVNPSSWRGVAVGHVGDDVRREGNLMAASLYIKDHATIARVKSGELVEISNGYECQMDPVQGKNDDGEEFDAIQRRIVGNHVALGPANWGRAGRNVRLYLDSDDTVTGVAFESASITDMDKPSDKAPEVKPKVEPAKDPAPAPEPVKAPEPEVKPEPAPALEEPELKKPGNNDSLDSVIDARLEIVAKAKRLVGDSFDYKGKSNAQIMAEVVSAKGLKVDGKGPDYVEARFDSLIEEADKTDSANASLVSLQAPTKTPGPVEVKVDRAYSARENMVQAGRDAWKSGTKATR